MLRIDAVSDTITAPDTDDVHGDQIEELLVTFFSMLIGLLGLTFALHAPEPLHA